MTQEPFDQEFYADVDRLMEKSAKVDLLPPRPRDAKARAYQQVSEDRRRFVLERHTQQTIARARKALEQPWKFGGRYEALRILQDAAPKYERLGGDTTPWPIFGGRR
jgi:hypothetical protein